MDKLKKTSRNGALVLVAMMLLTIPNMPIYSAVGSYHSNSMALVAIKDYKTIAMTSRGAVPALLAVAAGVGLAVVFAVGVVDGWNSHHPEIASSNFKNDYHKYDFSKFDN